MPDRRRQDEKGGERSSSSPFQEAFTMKAVKGDALQLMARTNEMHNSASSNTLLGEKEKKEANKRKTYVNKLL